MSFVLSWLMLLLKAILQFFGRRN